MIRIVPVPEGYTTKDYVDVYPELGLTISSLEALAKETARRLKDCTVWMVNSTAKGGGVAEGLPRIVEGLRRQQERLGSDFTLSELLVRKAEAGEKLTR